MTVKSRRRAASAIDIVGIAGDDEAAVAAAGLGIAPRQRDVDVADLVDLKALADGFDAAEGLEQRAQPLAGDAEDLEVDVALLRLRQPEQPVAHPAADNQRAAASLTHGFGNRACVHRSADAFASCTGLRPKRLTTLSVNPGANALRMTSARDLACG